MFKYLGRLVAFEDNDVLAMRSNLMKARKYWSHFSHVLRVEHTLPRVSEIFYKETVQAVLLFGSESWNLTLLALKCLEGFHIRIDCRMMGIIPKNEASTSTWIYPTLVDILESAGLYTIAEYI